MAALPPPCADESRRQREVDRTPSLLADTVDPVLDQLVALTSAYFRTPICVIAILDHHRQYFRARVGIDVRETSRDVSFCAHNLTPDHLLEICDAQQDARFADNPLVTGAPRIRYYAGMPLATADGQVLGSLCLIDTLPRSGMTTEDLVFLRAMTALVMGRLDALRQQSYFYPGTGLYNRVRLEQDVADHAAMARPMHLVAVEMLSAAAEDQLAKAFGYAFVNDFITRVRDLLQVLLPAECALYKLSPLRFALVFIEQPLSHVVRHLERLLNAFSVPLDCQNIPVALQPGFGVLELAGGQTLESDWLRLALVAAGEARQSGRGWLRYDPEVDRAQRRSMLIAGYLGEAIRQPGQLRLVYQPKRHLASGTCHSVEALIRWTHPLLGEISPAEFIPLAEKTALIRGITRWVAREAMHQARDWHARGIPLSVSINVSAIDLANGSLADDIQEVLGETGMNGNALEVEFTESALVGDMNQVKLQLQRLRSMGIGIAIDDFGSGYSNWAYLRDIPASTLKIDRSFMGNLQPGNRDWTVVRMLIGLARDLGLQVVAEGVETALDFELLRGWGCHEIQGYYVARPLGVADLETWLANDRPLLRLSGSCLVRA